VKRLFWQGEPAGSAFAYFAFEPNSTVVTLDDALTDGKADTVAGKLAAGMKTLEYLKKAVGVAHVKASTIVFTAKYIIGVCYGIGEIDRGDILFLCVFNGIRQNIVEEQLEHNRISLNDWKRTCCKVNAARRVVLTALLINGFNKCGHIDIAACKVHPGSTGKLKQMVDDANDFLCLFLHGRDKLTTIIIKDILIVGLKKAGKLPQGK